MFRYFNIVRRALTAFPFTEKLKARVGNQPTFGLKGHFYFSHIFYGYLILEAMPPIIFIPA